MIRGVSCPQARQPAASGDTVSYLSADRGAAIMGATVSRQVA